MDEVLNVSLSEDTVGGNSVGYDRLQYDKLREAQVEGIDQNRNNPPRRGIG